MKILLQELLTYLEEGTITPEVRAELIADCIHRTIGGLDLYEKKQIKGEQDEFR